MTIREKLPNALHSATLWKTIAVLALWLTTPPLFGCGGGEEEDDDPVSCSLNTSFTGPVHQNGSVILQTLSASCGRLNINVVFTGISDIFTVGFDVTYPAAIFEFDGISQGPLLKQGSPTTPPFFSVIEGTGRVTVFATRFNPDGSVDAVSDTVLLTLSFRALAQGAGNIVFDLASSPTEDQVRNESGALVSVTFLNGTNLARVF